MVAGFRPEGAACAPAAGRECRSPLASTRSSEPGTSGCGTSSPAGQRFAVRPPPGAAAAPGDEIDVAVDAAAVRLFHPDTGLAVP